MRFAFCHGFFCYAIAQHLSYPASRDLRYPAWGIPLARDGAWRRREFL